MLGRLLGRSDSARTMDRVAATFALAVGLCLLATSCPLLDAVVNTTAPDPAPLPTVPGPENERLLADVHGWVLHCDGDDSVEAIALPTLERTSIELAARPFFMSAPDEIGRFLYVCDGGGVEIMLANVDGRKEKMLARRIGSPLWNDTSTFIELSRRGGLVALGAAPVDDTSPYTEQHLEIWSLDDGSRTDLGPVFAWSAAWFPDCRRLLVERLVPPEEIHLHEAPPIAMRERDWGVSKHPGCVTSLQILDVPTKTWSWVGWGSDPLLSPNGEQVLFYRGGDQDAWCVTDLNGGSARTLELPGCLGFPIAWLAHDIVLYPASPTTGTDPGVARTPVKRPRANWTIKAGRIGGPDFLTVIPSASRFTTVSCSVSPADEAIQIK